MQVLQYFRRTAKVVIWYKYTKKNENSHIYVTAIILYLRHFTGVKIRNQAIITAFGRHIRELRMAKGLSQEGLAALAGIEKTQVGRIENGQVNTTISTIYALSEALEVPFKKILHFDL